MIYLLAFNMTDVLAAWTVTGVAIAISAVCGAILSLAALVGLIWKIFKTINRIDRNLQPEEGKCLREVLQEVNSRLAKLEEIDSAHDQRMQSIEFELFDPEGYVRQRWHKLDGDLTKATVPAATLVALIDRLQEQGVLISGERQVS